MRFRHQIWQLSSIFASSGINSSWIHLVFSEIWVPHYFDCFSLEKYHVDKLPEFSGAELPNFQSLCRSLCATQSIWAITAQIVCIAWYNFWWDTYITFSSSYWGQTGLMFLFRNLSHGQLGRWLFTSVYRLGESLILYYSDQVFSHGSQRPPNRTLFGFVMGHPRFRTAWHFMPKKEKIIKNCQKNSAQQTECYFFVLWFHCDVQRAWMGV